MTKQQAAQETRKNFQALIEAEGYRWSQEATDIVGYLLNEDDPKQAHYDGMSSDNCADSFIYYDDALGYLKDQSIYDFADAIEAGLTNASDFATFYLYEETQSLLDAIKFFELYDEVGEVSDEPEELSLDEKIKRAAAEISEAIIKDGNAELLEALKNFK